MPLFIVLSFCSQLVHAQPASATWALTSSANAGVSGAVTASPLAFSELEVRDYAGPNGPLGAASMRINPGPSAFWPHTTYSPATYCEFKVRPSSTQAFTVNNISLPMAGHNTGALRVEVYYSLDNFTTSVQLNTGGQILLNNGSYPSPATGYSPNVTVNPGATFTMRVYGYLSSQSTNTSRYFMMQNVVISGATGAVMPLSLLAFSARQKEAGVQVNWKTTNEVQTKSFGIERSADGRSFYSIGTIASSNKTGINEYAFTDNTGNGTNYYRLKMTDLDGTFQYSHNLLVKGDALTVKAFPNPTNGGIVIIHEITTDNIVAQVMDMQGRLLQNILVKAGTTQTVADLSALKPGSYIIQMINGSSKQSIQIQKL